MKQLQRIILCVGIALTFVTARPAGACTTFCYADGGTRVFGRNYDWSLGDGMLLVNKRGMQKVALVDGTPASWTSKYGSITFNQYGREFPTGGMNEPGLVVELMWLDEASYPGTDARGAMPTLQWIQYQLDNSATVDDVIKSDRIIRISAGGSAKIHFLVADARGGVATIEFLGGLLIAHHGDHLPYPVLTNNTYDESVEYMNTAGKRSGKSEPGSLDRFARAANYQAGAPDAATAVRNAFSLLDDVAQADFTQWSIVYDLGDRRAYFKTRKAGDVRWIDMDDLAFECNTPVKMLDINAALSGDVSKKMKAYDQKANDALVRDSFANTPFLRAIPADLRDDLAHYPGLTTCTGTAGRSGK